MRIKRFNENKEHEDFISIEDIKHIMSSLYDGKSSIDIEHAWTSLDGSKTAHITQDKEYNDDIRIALVTITIDNDDDNLRQYFEYGVDHYGLKNNNILEISNILKELSDISSHIQSEGYDMFTSFTSIGKLLCSIVICKKGELD